METFPDIKPTYSSSKQVKANVLKNDFGDGYRARAQNGINALPDGWDLDWVVSDATATVIIDFLEARGGTETFAWTGLGETVEKGWTCEGWTKDPLPNNYWRISCQFEQSFSNA